MGDKLKKVIFALECVIFLLVAVMLGLAVQRANTLSGQMESLESEVSSLRERIEEMEKSANAADIAAKNDSSASESAADSSEPVPTNTPIPTSTPEPTSTPMPTFTPAPMYLEDLAAYEPGEIIEDEFIDMENIGKYFTSQGIVEGDPIFARIIDRSFRYNEKIFLEDLRYIKLLHRNFEGRTQVGELIVNAAIEWDILDIFTLLYLNGYEINSMYLIDNFWAGDGDSSDFASIEMDNTSAFCYRTVTGSSGNLSNHAYGLAIDLNPLENPYVRVDGSGYATSSHSGSEPYCNNRSSALMPHVIDYDDLAYQLFTEHGFAWGGDWGDPKDYQHFQKELF
ncbi:MAG: M15 family metallopeptidase [Lachnospiraceae bacterium]|nr:M15 family metallopeptidase [Lachnospiraceae bacterium]